MHYCLHPACCFVWVELILSLLRDFDVHLIYEFVVLRCKVVPLSCCPAGSCLLPLVLRSNHASIMRALINHFRVNHLYSKLSGLKESWEWGFLNSSCQSLSCPSHKCSTHILFQPSSQAGITSRYKLTYQRNFYILRKHYNISEAEDFRIMEEKVRKLFLSLFFSPLHFGWACPLGCLQLPEGLKVQ